MYDYDAETSSQLIELSSPSDQRGVYVCRDCYARMTSMAPGSRHTPIRDGRGEEYCQVYRGLSAVYAECMSPDHAK